MLDLSILYIYSHHKHFFAVLILLLCISFFVIGQNTCTRKMKDKMSFLKRLFFSIPIWVCLSFISYIYSGFALSIIVVFILLCANSVLKIVFVREMGQEYDEIYKKIILHHKGLFMRIMGVYCFLYILLGFLLLVFCQDYETNWGFWVGIGIVYYAIITAGFSMFSFKKLVRDTSNVNEE